MNKPYEFIPFNSKVVRERIVGREKMLPNRYHGKMRLRITALTEMLVATGELEYVQNRLVKGLTTRDGIPVIPGSSFKGMSRAHAEMMSYSCNQSKAPKTKHRNSNDHLIDGNRYPCDAFYAKEPSEAEVCVCCRVYGFIGKSNKQDTGNKVAKGLIDFSEFTLQGDVDRYVTTTKIPPLYAPLRKEEAIDLYLNDEDYLQKKVYRHGKPQTHTGATYQVVTPGAVFEGEVAFLNLTKEELALFALSLGAAQGERRFQSKLGYAKPAHFGSVQVEVIDVIPYSRPFVRGIQPVTREDLFAWAEQYGSDEFLRSQVGKVVEHYQYKRDRNREWSVNARNQKGY